MRLKLIKHVSETNELQKTINNLSIDSFLRFHNMKTQQDVQFMDGLTGEVTCTDFLGIIYQIINLV